MIPEWLRLVWFDSLGAKSSSILIDVGRHRILVDPGVAVMHPSFPAPWEAKIAWAKEGYGAVLDAARNADIVVITHYHYDHFTDFDPRLYRGKTLIAKDPNRYINDSQRKRALSFYSRYFSELLGAGLEDRFMPPREEEYPDPMEALAEASSRDYGEYAERRRQLLARGRKWFRRRAENWSRHPRIPEVQGEGGSLLFADGRTVEAGEARLRFTQPLFHGVEYSRVGWVVALTVETPGFKLLYTSDLNGPVIEDYAHMIIDENPDVLVLDGPPTYLLGYTVNRINLERAIDNAVRILEEAGRLSLVIYDHHLVREPRYRERTRRVWERAEKLGIRLATAAELAGRVPAVLQFTGS